MGFKNLSKIIPPIITSVTDNFALKTSNTTLFCDATSKNIIITLPTAVNNKFEYIIKKIDSSANTVTINTINNETIEGNLAYILDKQFLAITIISDGNNWFIINKVSYGGYGN